MSCIPDYRIIPVAFGPVPVEDIELSVRISKYSVESFVRYVKQFAEKAAEKIRQSYLFSPAIEYPGLIHGNMQKAFEATKRNLLIATDGEPSCMQVVDEEDMVLSQDQFAQFYREHIFWNFHRYWPSADPEEIDAFVERMHKEIDDAFSKLGI